MTWILIAYGVGLFYFAVRQDKLCSKDKFRIAWISYALIPISHFVFSVIRTGYVDVGRSSSRMVRTVAAIEIWSEGTVWLLLGISLMVLINAIIPGSRSGTSGTSLVSTASDGDRKNIAGYP